MNPTRLRTLVAPASIALAIAFGALAAAPVARADEKPAGEKEESGADTLYVVNKEGKTITRKGEILEITALKIVFKTADGAKPFKLVEVQRFEFGGVPSGLGAAETAMNKSDYDAAASACKRVVEDCDAGRARPIFKQRALLAQGRALVAAGKFDEAGAALLAGAKATPAEGRVRECYRECVRAYIRARDAKKAGDVAAEAKGAFRTAELPEEAQDEAQLLVAEAKEASGAAADARTIYNLLTNSRDPKVKGRASLGAARAAFAGKEIDRAESQYRQIISDKDVERSVKCGAARGLGDAIMARPGAAKDLVKLRAAASAYAQAVAVQFPARGEPTDDREAALHEAAKVYDLLAETAGDKDGKAKELYGSIARQMREELVRLYKASTFRAENEQRLAKTGEAGEAGAPK